MLQRADRVVIGTVIPFVVLLLAAAVVLVIYVKPCPPGMQWDTRIKACRKKCASGQRYNTTTGMCECPDASAPVFDPVSQQCAGVCDPGFVWNAKSKSCDRVAQQCTPMPSVNKTTGVIVDATHFADGKGGCSSGSKQQLDNLCKSASCADPALCAAGDRWDGVDATGTVCYKKQVCGMSPCTASYCTSDSVHNNVGQIMQVADSNGKCVNPSEAAVGSMCTGDGKHVWRSPECYSTTPLNTLLVAVTSASSEAGKGIVGTVEHGLVNGVLDLDASGKLMYRYTLSTPASLQVNNRVMQLSASDATVATGAVLVTGACQPASAGNVCFNFQIDNDDIRRLPEATYVLRLTGFPSWDVTLPLYVTGQPPAFMLSANPVVPGSLDKLTVHFDLPLAQTVVANTLILKSKLTDLQKLLPNQVLPDPTVVAPSADSTSVSAQAIILDCQTGICRTDENITRKLVVLAWPALSLDKYALEGICPGGGAVIKYYLARSHTETQGSQTVVVDETLIGPTAGQLQPGSSEVNTGVISFVDLVDVNRVFTYKLVAYLADSVESTLEYRNAKCYGSMQTMAVSIGKYTAAGCHSIMYGVENSIPPYMTVTSAGTCTYDESEPAKDFYCLFDYTDKAIKPQPGFDQAHMALSSRNGNGCFWIQKMYPAFKVGANAWDSRFATPASLESCIAGAGQDVTVECADKLRLDTVGDTLSKTELQSRLSKVYDNFDTYKYSNTLDASKAKLDVGTGAGATAAETTQLNTLFDTYAYCPVRKNANYGNDSKYDACFDLSTDTQAEVCKRARFCQPCATLLTRCARSCWKQVIASITSVAHGRQMVTTSLHVTVLHTMMTSHQMRLPSVVRRTARTRAASVLVMRSTLACSALWIHAKISLKSTARKVGLTALPWARLHQPALAFLTHLAQVSHVCATQTITTSRNRLR